MTNGYAVNNHTNSGMLFASYADALAYLGTKDSRPYPKGKPRSTRVEKRDNGVAIKYHDTDVVLYTPDYIELNSGGWRTVTTKARMNDALPYTTCVSQTRGVWYIGSAVYTDGAQVDYAGNLITPEDTTEEKRILELSRKINNYAREFIEALQNGAIDMPGPGDCWYCYFTDGTKPIGYGQQDHLLAHIDENYFVPSLLVSAIKERGSVFDLSRVGAYMTQTPMRDSRYYADRLRRMLRDYLKQQLAIAR